MEGLQEWFDSGGGSDWGPDPDSAYDAYSQAQQIQDWFDTGGYQWGDDPQSAYAAFEAANHGDDGGDVGFDETNIQEWFRTGGGNEWGDTPEAAYAAYQQAAAHQASETAAEAIAAAGGDGIGTKDTRWQEEQQLYEQALPQEEQHLPKSPEEILSVYSVPGSESYIDEYRQEQAILNWFNTGEGYNWGEDPASAFAAYQEHYAYKMAKVEAEKEMGAAAIVAHAEEDVAVADPEELHNWFENDGGARYGPDPRSAYVAFRIAEASASGVTPTYSDAAYPTEFPGGEGPAAANSAAAMTDPKLVDQIKDEAHREQAGISAVHVAAATGNAVAVSNALRDSGADVREDAPPEQSRATATDSCGRTPLHFIALAPASTKAADARGSAEVLLQCGADVNAVDADGRSPVHWSGYHGHAKVLELLLDAGATWEQQDQAGRTAMHWACSLDSAAPALEVLAKRCTESGGNIDLRDQDAMTALHWACFHGLPAHCQLLLDAGASPLAPDHEGKSPLHWAAGNKTPACVEILLAKVSSDADRAKLVEMVDAEGRTALHMGTAEGIAAVIASLLAVPDCNPDAQDLTGRPALHFGASLGLVDCVSLLLDHGATPELADSSGGTAMHYAAQHGMIEVIKLLASRSADLVSISDVNGASPAMWAVAAGASTALATLIELGSAIDGVDSSGRSLLHAAAYAGDRKCINQLTAAGADVGVADESGQIALFPAADQGHAEVVQLLLDAGSKHSHQDVEGRCAVHWAAIAGETEAVKVLAAAGADLDVYDQRGETPLHYSAFFGKPDTALSLCDVGASVNVQDYDGISPLHWAALQGHQDIATMLLNHDAYPNFMEANGNKATPLDYAVGNGHEALAQMLADAGAVDYEEMERLAVTLVQATWRGFRARKEYTSLLNAEKAAEKEKQEAAAVLLQSTFRGFAARKAYKAKLSDVKVKEIKRTKSEKLRLETSGRSVKDMMQEELEATAQNLEAQLKLVQKDKAAAESKVHEAKIKATEEMKMRKTQEAKARQERAKDQAIIKKVESNISAREAAKRRKDTEEEQVAAARFAGEQEALKAQRQKQQLDDARKEARLAALNANRSKLEEEVKREKAVEAHQLETQQRIQGVRAEQKRVAAIRRHVSAAIRIQKAWREYSAWKKLDPVRASDLKHELQLAKKNPAARRHVAIMTKAKVKGARRKQASDHRQAAVAVAQLAGLFASPVYNDRHKQLKSLETDGNARSTHPAHRRGKSTVKNVASPRSLGSIWPAIRSEYEGPRKPRRSKPPRPAWQGLYTLSYAEPAKYEHPGGRSLQKGGDSKRYLRRVETQTGSMAELKDRTGTKVDLTAKILGGLSVHETVVLQVAALTIQLWWRRHLARRRRLRTQVVVPDDDVSYVNRVQRENVKALYGLVAHPDGVPEYSPRQVQEGVKPAKRASEPLYVLNSRIGIVEYDAGARLPAVEDATSPGKHQEKQKVRSKPGARRSVSTGLRLPAIIPKRRSPSRSPVK